VTAAIPADPPSVNNTMNPPGVGGQGNALQELVLAGLTIYDPTGRLHPQLAETVPSVENGLWKVSPDGRMETTWRIREGALWQDGTPLSAADLLFTTVVGQDRELPALGGPGYKAVDRMEMVDARTVLVTWKEPYIDADR